MCCSMDDGLHEKLQMRVMLRLEGTSPMALFMSFQPRDIMHVEFVKIVNAVTRKSVIGSNSRSEKQDPP